MNETKIPASDLVRLDWGASWHKVMGSIQTPARPTEPAGEPRLRPARRSVLELNLDLDDGS